jgi:hypothetical protein
MRGTLDNVGISEWKDRVERKVVIPSSITRQTIFHGLRRGLKHTSVGCDHMTPFFVSLQVNDNVTRRLKSDEFRINSDVRLRKCDEPYMKATLFTEYRSTVLLPHIAKIQSDPGFTDKEAVLLMDNCSPHM